MVSAAFVRLGRKLLDNAHVKNALIASGVGAAGDLGCQYAQGQDNIQIDRTARVAEQRLLIWGPLYSVWMTWIERFVGNATCPRVVLKKIALDQFLWAPPMIGVFYISMGILEGQPLATTWHRQLGNSFWDGLLWQTVCLNWQCWFAVQSVTYGMIPQPYRIMFVSAVNVLWNAKLSQLHHEGSHGAKEAVKDKSKEKAADAEVAGGLEMGAKILLVPKEEKYYFRCPSTCMMPGCTSGDCSTKRILFVRPY